ncbi:hypothetical protein BD770DRAFT_470766 [Pilaira anomala]|nr:hypothetical protein BD770DRAFT_470766 [Pilaira anomala]
MENGYKKWFHSDTEGFHLLFEPLTFTESSDFITGYLLVSILCALERGITYWLDCRTDDQLINARTADYIYQVLARTIMYGLATTLKFLYMLVVMYFNTGLFFAVVISLTLSQLVVELVKTSRHNKTGPLHKLQNKGYSDLSVVAQTNAEDEDEDEDEDEEYSKRNRSKEYNIPKIVISET